MNNPDTSGELPRGVMLFGPPGTGKSNVAHAIASRLGWPCFELFPAGRPPSTGWPVG
ncbi:AAA family ATPase [Streptomyces sp. NPDC056527]|uniref:AAA family ATPase n=1 Tax=Streptomyces sp. NPDC056527 TaxID=3345853 RepID=UPI0036D0362E